MSTAIDGIFNFSKPVILTFQNLFVPRTFKDKKGNAKGDPKFDATFMFAPDHPDFDRFKALAGTVAKARWPGVSLATLHKPWDTGDAKADKRKAKTGKDDSDFQRGLIVVIARSTFQPRLSYIENGAMVDLEAEAAVTANKRRFFAGAEVLAQLNLQPYESDLGANGVTAYLNIVVATGGGKPIPGIGGGARGSDVFKGYAGTVSDRDPTAGDPNAGVAAADQW